MTAITLRGMTWNHPRGYDPLVACSALWRERTGVEVSWDKRSLQDFESYPVEDLAQRYDLIIVDHPHVGQITKEGCLAPLDGPEREAERAALAAASVGASYQSYVWDGHLWALPVDAATQVQAWCPDRLPGPLETWSDVLALAREGKVLCPMRAPHSLMCFYTLAANRGTACRTTRGDLIGAADGAAVYAELARFAALIDPACFTMDPIAVFERMAEADSPVACVPFTYGYISYAADGFRPARIAFADIPVWGSQGPVGSALGGTGLAASARSAHREAAIDFAYWVASSAVQRSTYTASGGQAGHAEAWRDPAVNAPVHGFYANTWATLAGAWLRPRHDGYMPFQHWAAERLNAGLTSLEPAATVVADLNAAFAASFDRG